MSMLSPYDWSTTASSNTDLGGGTVANSQMYPSGVDNAFREMMAEIARTLDSLGGVNTVGGTASAITVTIGEDWSAYATGQLLAVKASSASAGATTLNVTPKSGSALGAKAIRRQGDSAIQANDMLANGVYLLRYDASYNSAAGAWVLLNPAPVWSAVTGTPTTLSGYGITDTIIKSVKVLVFTSSGTYTPSTGMVFCLIEGVGGGGSGGGVAATNSSQNAVSSGGAAGTYGRKLCTAADIGASKTVTIGAAGAAPTAGGNAGNAGGTTSVGSLLSLPGGGGGSTSAFTTGGVQSGGTTSAATGADVWSAQPGTKAIGNVGAFTAAGDGGSSPFGAGGLGGNFGNAGAAATGYGSGGGGSTNGASSSARSAGAGTAGLVIITEFCTQ